MKHRNWIVALSALVVIGGSPRAAEARRAESWVCSTFYLQHDNCLTDMSVECENRGCPEPDIIECTGSTPHAGWMKVECRYSDW
jgi:hypothetical protein